jgi:uncharacterized phage protein (TIGR01671 family)
MTDKYQPKKPKFRGMDENKEMFTSEKDGLEEFWYGVHDGQFKYCGQFTGKNGKEGIEICQGDILLIPDEETERILDDGSGPTYEANHLAVVIFQNGSFGVDIPESGNDFHQGFYSFDRIEYEIGETELEIVGNIYQSPELLGENE